MAVKCFYHAGDLDGWCSGAIVRHFYNQENIEVEMYPINYGDKFPEDDISTNDIVYMCDYSISLSDMQRMNAKCNQNLIWIDHHIGAIRESEDYVFLKGSRDTRFSGCELTWMYLCDDEIPQFIRLLGRYDVWDHTGDCMSWENIEAFQYGFKAAATNPRDNMRFWNSWFDISNSEPSVRGSLVRDKILTGFKIQKYVEDRFQSNITDRSYIIDWEGYKCLVINSDPYIANFMTRCEEYKGCDLAINFCSNKGKSWIVNLRTIRDDIDLSVLAKKYGGGGHSGAAGFNCKELPF